MSRYCPRICRLPKEETEFHREWGCRQQISTNVAGACVDSAVTNDTRLEVTPDERHHRGTRFTVGLSPPVHVRFQSHLTVLCDERGVTHNSRGVRRGGSRGAGGRTDASRVTGVSALARSSCGVCPCTGVKVLVGQEPVNPLNPSSGYVVVIFRMASLAGVWANVPKPLAPQAPPGMGR